MYKKVKKNWRRQIRASRVEIQILPPCCITLNFFSKNVSALESVILEYTYVQNVLLAYSYLFFGVKGLKFLTKFFLTYIHIQWSISFHKTLLNSVSFFSIFGNKIHFYCNMYTQYDIFCICNYNVYGDYFNLSQFIYNC